MLRTPPHDMRVQKKYEMGRNLSECFCVLYKMSVNVCEGKQNICEKTEKFFHHYVP